MPVEEATSVMSPISSGGINTESITCMIPLEATTSAAVTVAPPNITEPLTKENVTLSSLAIVKVIPSTISDEVTYPEATWNRRMSARTAISSSLSKLSRSIPAIANASSVGAKTVNGPSVCRVVTRLAFDNAATNAV